MRLLDVESIQNFDCVDFASFGIPAGVNLAEIPFSQFADYIEIADLHSFFEPTLLRLIDGSGLLSLLVHREGNGTGSLLKVIQYLADDSVLYPD